jgi:hypothetical protein
MLSEVSSTMRCLSVIGIVAFLTASSSSLWAVTLISTDRLSYTGTQTKYATLADAQSETSPIGGPFAITNRATSPPYDTPYRDLALYFAKDAVAAYAASDFNYVSTAWYYSTSGGAFSGTGNPNNSDNGFIQLYDDDGSTETSLQSYFHDDLTQYTLQVSGINATNALDFTRLWNAAGEPNTGGTFHSYDVDITFGGLAGAWNPSTNTYEATNHPSTVTGTFHGIFENTSAVNSFYVVDWTYAFDNWAFGQGGSLVEGGIQDSFFASDFNLVAPEPTSGILLGLGVMIFLRRKKTRQVQLS